MCELGNDKARSLALDKLPPDLFETYERVLDRVESHGPDARNIVMRTLQWTIGSVIPLTITQLREAIAVPECDKSFDTYAMVDEKYILRECSRFIRRTPDSQSVEIAHFTVEEFFRSIRSSEKPQYMGFAHLNETIQTSLAKTCLRYLGIHDFAVAKVENCFWKRGYQSWLCAAKHWREHYVNCSQDPLILKLVHALISPIATRQFSVWTKFDQLKGNRWSRFLDPNSELASEEEDMEDLTMLLERADPITPLHQAAFYVLPELISWLLASGLDPNKSSCIGRPLECVLYDGCLDRSSYSEDRTLDCIRALLDSKSIVNFTCIQDGSKIPLALAVDLENKSYIRALLQAGADVDIRCLSSLNDQMSRKRSTGTILHDFLAIIHSLKLHLPDDIESLLMQLCLSYFNTTEFGIDLAEKNTSLESESIELLNASLYDAARRGETEATTRLLQLVDSPTSFRDKCGRNTLHVASMNGHVDVVQLLLRKGAEANSLDNDKNTPAHLCTRNSPGIRTLKALIESGFEITLQNVEGQSCLHIAATKSDPEVLRYLLNTDPTGCCTKLRDKDGNWPVLLAIANSKLLPPSILESLSAHLTIEELRKGNNRQETCLHVAADVGDEAAIEILTTRGLLDERSIDGSTVLHHAAKDHNSPEIFNQLVKAGADLGLRNKDGMLVLHVICQNNCVSLISDYLKSDQMESYVNLLDASGRGLLHVIAEAPWFCSVHVDAFKIIVEESSIDLNLRDNSGRTALILIARLMGNMQSMSNSDDCSRALSILIRAGADVNLKDKNGSTALHYVCMAERSHPAKAAVTQLIVAPRSCGGMTLAFWQ